MQPISQLFTYIESRANSKWYPYVLALVLMLTSWMLVLPEFFLLDPDCEAWQTIFLKSQDLTHQLDHIPPESWLSKKVFRLTIPVFLKFFPLTPAAVIIVQAFVGYFIYVLTFKLTRKITKDAVVATFLMAAVAFLFFGRVAYYDINFTWFDTFAFFFLLCAMYSKNALVIFLFSTLASWTDERAFVALGIVLLFHLMSGATFEGNRKVVFQRLIRREVLSVLAAMLMYLLLRLVLMQFYGMHTPTEGANWDMIKVTYPYLPFGIWTFLEGLWILFIIAIFLALARRELLQVVFFVLPVIVFILIAGLVSDITRSGSYLVPLVFVLLGYVSRHLDQSKLRYTVLIGAAITLFFPAVVICTDWYATYWFESNLNQIPKIV